MTPFNASAISRHDEHQAKRFTRWANIFLADRGLEIKDLLGGDLDSGIILHALIEELSGQKLKSPGQMSKGQRRLSTNVKKLQFGFLEDISISLQFLKRGGILKIDITPDSILHKNTKQILALFSHLMSKYHFLTVTRTQEKERLRKERVSQAEKIISETILSDKAESEKKIIQCWIQADVDDSGTLDIHEARAFFSQTFDCLTDGNAISREAKDTIISEWEKGAQSDDGKISLEAFANFLEDVLPSYSVQSDYTVPQPTGPDEQASSFISWCQQHGVTIQNLTTDFQDGKKLCEMVNILRPNVIPSEIVTDDATSNLNLAIDISLKEFGIPKLLSPDDFLEFADPLTNITYLSFFKSKKQELDAAKQRAQMIQNAVEMRKAKSESSFMDLEKLRKDVLVSPGRSELLSTFSHPEVSINVIKLDSLQSSAGRSPSRKRPARISFLDVEKEAFSEIEALELKLEELQSRVLSLEEELVIEKERALDHQKRMLKDYDLSLASVAEREKEIKELTQSKIALEQKMLTQEAHQKALLTELSEKEADLAKLNNLLSKKESSLAEATAAAQKIEKAAQELHQKTLEENQALKKQVTYCQELKNQNEELTNKASSLAHTVAELETTKEMLTKDLQTEKGRSKSFEEKAAKLQDGLKEKSAEVERHKTEIALIEEKNSAAHKKLLADVSEANSQTQESQAKFYDLLQSMGKLQSQITTLQEESLELKKSLRQQTEKANEAQEKYLQATNTLEQERERKRIETKELLEKSKNLQSELEATKAEHSRLLQEAQSKFKQREDAEKEAISQFEPRLTALQQELEKANTENRELKETIAQKNEELAQLKEQRKAVDERIEELKADAKQAQKEALKEKESLQDLLNQKEQRFQADQKSTEGTILELQQLVSKKEEELKQSKAHSQEELQTEQNRRVALETQLAQAREKLKSAEETTKEEIERISQEEKRAQADLTQCKAEKETISQQLDQEKATCSKAKEDFNRENESRTRLEVLLQEEKKQRVAVEEALQRLEETKSNIYAVAEAEKAKGMVLSKELEHEKTKLEDCNQLLNQQKEKGLQLEEELCQERIKRAKATETAKEEKRMRLEIEDELKKEKATVARLEGIFEREKEKGVYSSELEKERRLAIEKSLEQERERRVEAEKLLEQTKTIHKEIERSCESEKANRIELQRNLEQLERNLEQQKQSRMKTEGSLVAEQEKTLLKEKDLNELKAAFEKLQQALLQEQQAKQSLNEEFELKQKEILSNSKKIEGERDLFQQKITSTEKASNQKLGELEQKWKKSKEKLKQEREAHNQKMKDTEKEFLQQKKELQEQIDASFQQMLQCKSELANTEILLAKERNLAAMLQEDFKKKCEQFEQTTASNADQGLLAKQEAADKSEQAAATLETERKQAEERLSKERREKEALAKQKEDLKAELQLQAKQNEELQRIVTAESNKAVAIQAKVEELQRQKEAADLKYEKALAVTQQSCLSEEEKKNLALQELQRTKEDLEKAQLQAKELERKAGEITDTSQRKLEAIQNQLQEERSKNTAVELLGQELKETKTLLQQTQHKLESELTRSNEEQAVVFDFQKLTHWMEETTRTQKQIRAEVSETKGALLKTQPNDKLIQTIHRLQNELEEVKTKPPPTQGASPSNHTNNIGKSSNTPKPQRNHTQHSQNSEIEQIEIQKLKIYFQTELNKIALELVGSELQRKSLETKLHLSENLNNSLNQNIIYLQNLLYIQTQKSKKASFVSVNFNEKDDPRKTLFKHSIMRPKLVAFAMIAGITFYCFGQNSTQWPGLWALKPLGFEIFN